MSTECVVYEDVTEMPSLRGVKPPIIVFLIASRCSGVGGMSSDGPVSKELVSELSEPSVDQIET